jgi:predicted NBD/HSP70 family sugar kinase
MSSRTDPTLQGALGPPPSATADAAPTVLGVDFGGTKVALMIVDAAGAVVQTHRLPTAPERGAALVL